MLTDEQIDYLFEIKKSGPALSDNTVRAMLRALRWTHGEIEHSIKFLNRKAIEATTTEPRGEYVPEIPESEKDMPVVVKQKPFFGGGYHLRHHLGNADKKTVKKPSKHGVFSGAIFGLTIFIIGLIVYYYISLR